MSGPSSDLSTGPSIRPSADPHAAPSAGPSSGPSPVPSTAAMVAPAHEDFRKPRTISGGCLCRAVRYKVDFKEDHDFLKSSNSCQCTQRRRQTGTLVYYTHTIPVDCLKWHTQVVPIPGNPAMVGPPTMKYQRTPVGYQFGFCQNCGSTLYWKDEARSDLELALGTVDPEFLNGSSGEPGRATDDGYRFALANCGGANRSCDQKIKGLTDLIPQRDQRYFRNAPAEGRRKRKIEGDHEVEQAEELRKQTMEQHQKAEPQKAEPQKAEPQKEEPQKEEPQKEEPQKAEPQKGSEHLAPEETRAEVVVADAPVEAEQ
ncbi:glutathione-dependent formaldehyde-activating enzyme [Apiospora saccharicola]